MGGRLTTPPPSSTTAHRTLSTNSANSSHQRHHSNGGNHHHNRRHQQQHAQRARAAPNNLDPLSPTAFNINLLRYVGIEHESDDQTSDDDSPAARRRLQHFFLAFRDVPCPVCHKTIPSDSFDKHILQCLSKPRIDYNGLLKYILL